MRIYTESIPIRGILHVRLFDQYGYLLGESVEDNIVTQVGDQAYAERAANIGAPAAPTGMKLGTGSTAPSKTGAGSQMTTYLTNSHQAFDATYPTSALQGASRRIWYRTTWPAGKATSAGAIAECCIVNNTLADATALSANTVSRALVTGVPSKSATDVIIADWTHDFGG